MPIRVGDIVEGMITGIQPYGAFVSLDNGYKGLIHISEISERYVRDVHSFVHMNERVSVKVLDISDMEHIKLSLKAVAPNKQRFQFIKHAGVQPLPDSVIGFSSLAVHLNDWIETAYEKNRRNYHD